MARQFTPKRGFTIIELMVATAILVILASVTILFLGTTRRNSRDARRKADVQTISSGISQYTVIAGTTFIKVAGQQCNLPDEINPATVGTGAGCVGASGRSYGKMNLKGDGVNVTSSGYATNPGRVYMTISIGKALLDAGYLTSMPQDPLAKVSDTTNPNAPDYVLIRACAVTGEQQVGTRGTVFAVWTSLENGPTDQEKANSDHYPGGRLAGPTGAGTYVYDFAAQQSEWLSGAYYVNGFGVGNGITKVAGAQPCWQGPVAG
jgi:prepilin-type N-terminal cleavage/methylation domain-containing protein